MTNAFISSLNMFFLVLDKGKKSDDGLSYKPDLFGKHGHCYI